jgi:hypothetical protein
VTKGESTRKEAAVVPAAQVAPIAKPIKPAAPITPRAPPAPSNSNPQPTVTGDSWQSLLTPAQLRAYRTGRRFDFPMIPPGKEAVMWNLEYKHEHEDFNKLLRGGWHFYHQDFVGRT